MLTLTNLRFGYPGRDILDDVTMTVDAGTISCLLGGNGSGKTTVFYLIGGLLRPTAGTIRFGGQEISGRRPHKISRLGIGLTFQDLRFIGRITVRENLLLAHPQNPAERLPAALFALSVDARRQAAQYAHVDALLADYFLTDVADRLASQISFGQQKLLTLACCVASGASLLLLDEPVAGISSEYRERLARCILDLRRAGKTIVVIEHQREFLEKVGDKFFLLEGGRLDEFSSLAELGAASVALDPHW